MFKSNQEPWILDLKHAVRKSMPTVKFEMERPVEEHQSNGTNEVTICEKHRVRVMEEFVGREDDMFSTFEASSGFRSHDQESISKRSTIEAEFHGRARGTFVP